MSLVPVHLLGLAAAAATYAMSLSGVPVGRARLTLEAIPDGRRLTYESEALVRRGPVVVRLASFAQVELGPSGAVVGLTAERREGGVKVATVEVGASGDALVVLVSGADGRLAPSPLAPGVVPSALAPLLFAASSERQCLRVIEETSGRVGEACGAGAGETVTGTLFGEAFRATVDAAGLARLELTSQRLQFARDTDVAPLPPPPPDFFGAGVPTRGLAEPWDGEAILVRLELPQGHRLSPPQTASQRVATGPGGLTIHWARAAPRGDEPLRPPVQEGEPIDSVAAELLAAPVRSRWEAAREIARWVFEHVEDKRPGESERSPTWVFSSKRAACVGHTELFLAIARRVGLPARRVVGLVAAEGRFWAHAWAEVEVKGSWYDVDPTEGEAPARAPRLALAATDRESEAVGRVLSLPSGTVSAVVER